MNTPPTAPAPSIPPAENSGKRRRALLLLTLLLLAVGLACGEYWRRVLRWQETTDDAYVAGHIVQITPQVGGTVKAVFADDTDAVEAGDALVALDDADSRVALDQAEAALAQAVRTVRALYADNAALRAQVAARQAEAERLHADWARRAALVDSGAVAREEAERARDTLRAARSALTAAREQWAANRALTEGTEITRHPGVLLAAAKVEEAWLAWSRSRIDAPVSGLVAKRGVQIGQRVAAGAPLMAVAPLATLWVDANFKEVQLGRMRIGQPVTLRADYYGADVRYRGRVVGLAAGTGSAFALLPAQNATGNWIKVVQRVPVRIELEADELAAHPLRIGLSMRATVDIRDNGGEIVASARKIAKALPPDERTPSGGALDQARARIAEIIREHGGAAPGAAGK
ncbi:MAG: HlyD family efflux transporter periplasmic adaptor subunit [Candidatus Accumulibacter sp.]|jgi:membrane fusion protein (multidrug efflux system)|nr:HlyD family efflux transporter periplasmic adaptor subunit [Accumulibacter sp.]